MAEIWTCSWCKKLNLPAPDCLWCYGLRKQGEAACWEIIQAMRTATIRCSATSEAGNEYRFL